jgi:hypothetical protein
MITVERDVARLLKEGLLDKEIAEQHVADPAALKRIKVKGKGLFG